MKHFRTLLKKGYQLIVRLLSEGITPSRISWAIMIGITVGLIPFIGINTILLTLIALVFRLNVALIQIVNYVVYPFQLLLYLPFLKLGCFISGNPQLTLTFKEIKNSFKDSWWNAVVDLWSIHLWGLIAWLLISIPLGVILYFVLMRIFRNLNREKKSKYWIWLKKFIHS